MYRIVFWLSKAHAEHAYSTCPGFQSSNTNWIMNYELTPNFSHISISPQARHKPTKISPQGEDKNSWPTACRLPQQTCALLFFMACFSVQLSYMLNFPLAIKHYFGVARESWIFVRKALWSEHQRCKLQTPTARWNSWHRICQHSEAGWVEKAGTWIGQDW